MKASLSKLLLLVTLSPLPTLAAEYRLGSGPGTLTMDSSVGIFDSHADIGSPKLAGSASFDAVKQEYTLSAGGANVWATRDEFQFLWKKLQGDFILRARVEFIGQGTDPHRKLGWMVRPTLDDDAPYVDTASHGDGLTSLQFRARKVRSPTRPSSRRRRPRSST
jgi:hypothetical protein